MVRTGAGLGGKRTEPAFSRHRLASLALCFPRANPVKRFLFTAIPEKRHLNPMIGPAIHLQRRGPTVAFYTPADVSLQLTKAGLTSLNGHGVALPPPDLN